MLKNGNAQTTMIIIYKLLTESPQADKMELSKVLHVPWQRVGMLVTLPVNAVTQTVLLLNVPTAVTQAIGVVVGVG